VELAAANQLCIFYPKFHFGVELAAANQLCIFYPKFHFGVEQDGIRGRTAAILSKD